MYICQWSLEIVFGKQKEALEIMRRWGEEKIRSSNFRKAKNCRILCGYIGESPSLIIDEYGFENLDDFENALADMSLPQFRKFSEALSQFVVPASQKWKIFKII